MTNTMTARFYLMFGLLVLSACDGGSDAPTTDPFSALSFEDSEKPGKRRGQGGTGSDTGTTTPPSDSGGTTTTPPPAGMTSVTYVPSTVDFLNPERGFHDWISLATGSDFSFVASNGLSLAYAGVNLSSFRYSSISSTFLSQLTAGFAKVRQAGIKVILRFYYASSIGDADASKSRILGHIAQLQPLLQANADVIALMQAGFIGAWGEWHNSTNGLDNTTDRKDILFAILDALPPSRFVQIRTPHFKSWIFGSSSPVSAAEAYSGSYKSRTGHHNDAFLNGPGNDGTYLDPIDPWKSYVAQDTLYVPIGGESNDVYSPYTDGPYAVQEMAYLHYSFLNILYHPDVINGWIAQGYMPEIRRRLGYRLALVDASWTSSVPPGGELDLTVHLKNEGWASMYNARPLYVVLSAGSTKYTAQIASVDPRTWKGGTETTFTRKLRVPIGAPQGTYALALWLPDDAASIQSDPRYAVRLANEGVWNAASGTNLLTSQLPISTSASGSVDPSATLFVEVP